MRVFLASGETAVDDHILSLEASGALRVVGAAHAPVPGLKDKISAALPDVVVLSFACAGPDEKGVIKALRLALPESRIIYLASSKEICPYLISLGIYDFLVAQGGRFSLSALESRLFQPASFADVASYQETGKQEAAPARSGRSKVVAFWSPVGGTGKSVLAFNYAVLRPGSVLLADLDIQTPVLDLYAGLAKEACGRDLYALLTRQPLTLESVKAHVLDLHPRLPGHKFLPGLQDARKFDAVSVQHFYELLDTASQGFDCVVADVNSCPYIDATSVVLDAADTVFVPVVNDYACLRETARYLGHLTSFLGMPASKFCLVVNKYREEGVDAGNIASGLPYPIAAVVPYSALIIQRVNSGKAFVLDGSRELRKAADILAAGMLGDQGKRRLKLFGNR